MSHSSSHCWNFQPNWGFSTLGCFSSDMKARFAWKIFSLNVCTCSCMSLPRPGQPFQDSLPGFEHVQVLKSCAGWLKPFLEPLVLPPASSSKECRWPVCPWPPVASSTGNCVFSFNARSLLIRLIRSSRSCISMSSFLPMSIAEIGFLDRYSNIIISRFSVLMCTLSWACLWACGKNASLSDWPNTHACILSRSCSRAWSILVMPTLLLS